MGNPIKPDMANETETATASLSSDETNEAPSEKLATKSMPSEPGAEEKTSIIPPSG